MTRDSRGRFLTGGNGGPGRPSGSRNSFGGEVIAAIQADWRVHGSGIIDIVRKKNPSAYLRTIVSLLPREFLLDTPSDYSQLLDEEFEAELCESLVSMALYLKKPKLVDAIKQCFPEAERK